MCDRSHNDQLIEGVQHIRFDCKLLHEEGLFSRTCHILVIQLLVLMQRSQMLFCQLRIVIQGEVKGSVLLKGRVADNHI